jgi:radical SAM/Cys-rich protein
MTQTASLDSAVGLAFVDRVKQAGAWPIRAGHPTTLQMNLGYRCNQRCAHCHLEAGPERTEQMSREVMQAALDFAARAGITDFDLTGGAPELNPHFRWLVTTLVSRGASVTDRCNLTILAEPGQQDLADFLAVQGVQVVCSLPHYRAEMTRRVRGDQVFERSISGLQKLNAAGYGHSGSRLELVLVHSPAGAILPGRQSSLEQEFRSQLHDQHGIVFTRLIVLTNNPTGRFLSFLERSGNLERYLARLEQQFNPATVANLMCRHLISVAWNGSLYDCDFNQALGMEIRSGSPARIESAAVEALVGREVRCGNHCYACTAGQGSSCGGAVAE